MYDYLKKEDTVHKDGIVTTSSNPRLGILARVVDITDTVLRILGYHMKRAL